LREAGIHTFFNGPESFTPDDRYYLGEAPEIKGYWVAAGYNSIGISPPAARHGAGAVDGMDGEPPFDLWEVDIRRAQPFQKNRHYLQNASPKRSACFTPITFPTGRWRRRAVCAGRQCTSS
jgi:hypothetical protein